MNQTLNSNQNYLSPMFKMNKTKYFFNSKNFKMKTLNQLFAFALCVLTFSTVVAQKDTTNDHWRNAGINTWTQPSRSVGIGTNSPKEKLHIQGGINWKRLGNHWKQLRYWRKDNRRIGKYASIYKFGRCII